MSAIQRIRPVGPYRVTAYAANGSATETSPPSDNAVQGGRAEQPEREPAPEQDPDRGERAGGDHRGRPAVRRPGHGHGGDGDAGHQDGQRDRPVQHPGPPAHEQSVGPYGRCLRRRSVTELSTFVDEVTTSGHFGDPGPGGTVMAPDTEELSMITVTGLTKRYADSTVVDDVSASRSSRAP